jgi:predicted  nucleic acid-binding Zn-ribbon protein
MSSPNLPNPTDKPYEPEFEIRDPDLSKAEVEEIMNRIRQRIRQRAQQAEANGLHYGLPNLATSRKLPAEFYKSLEQARASAGSVRVPLAASSGLVGKVRKVVHQLVVYYVNMMADKQMVFNRASANTQRQLAQALEAANARIEALEQDVANLRAQQGKPPSA